MKLSLLNEGHAPCYGIYYWVPVNNSWELYPYLREALPFGNEEYGQGRPLLHRYFWEDAIVPELGLKGEATLAYLGLPRGRVSAVGKRFVIYHAETPGGKQGLEKVRAAFFLPPTRTEFLYDNHMEVIDKDYDIVSKQIGQYSLV